MTAEVAVLNRIGVALAADSAVSIGRRADKIWTSADKLFQLSEEDPVGVMIHGNAEFVGSPWETIIKDYRRFHGRASFPNVRAHAENFLSYLAGHRRLFPSDRQDRRILLLCGSLLLHARDRVRDAISKEAESRGGLSDSDLDPICNISIAALHASVLGHKMLDFATTAYRRRVRTTYARPISGLIDNHFGKLPMSRRTKAILVDLVLEMLWRVPFSPFRSGLVISGFGRDDYTPALVAFELEEMLLDKPRSNETRFVQIDDDNTATVVPFAQQETLQSFMEGVDRRFLELICATTGELFEGALDAIAAALQVGATSLQRKKLKAAKAALLQGSLEQLFKKWSVESRKYWEPVVTNIASLPKDELAAMAEAFVNLTKFRRRVSTDRETVGGPIDVAVITKGDGFVWVQRKHYFDALKNIRAIGRQLGRFQ